jgi:hypothetical protein
MRGQERYRPSGRRFSILVILALGSLTAACQDSGKGQAASIEAIGGVGAQLILDRNGNGGVDQGDTVLVGWTVNLEQPAGGIVASQTTDASGIAIFQEVPVGRIVARVPDSELGDTLNLLPASVQPFILAAFQTAEITPVVTLPTFKVQDVRTLSTGKPLFTEGVALNRLVEGDLTLHIRSGSSYLRILSVEESTGFNTGDSVRVSGRTALDQGVPVLDGKSVFRLRAGSGTPAPIVLSTGEAAGALAGSLDAALVRINGAEILEVVEDGDRGVYLRVDDGTGQVRIRFRRFFQLDPDSIDPETDSISFAVGLLVPVRVGEEVVWEVQPRTTDDVVLLRIQAE